MNPFNLLSPVEKVLIRLRLYQDALGPDDVFHVIYDELYKKFDHETIQAAFRYILKTTGLTEHEFYHQLFHDDFNRIVYESSLKRMLK